MLSHLQSDVIQRFPNPALCVWVGMLVAQSCLTVGNPMNCNPPASSVCGILQARILEWVPFPSPGDLPEPGAKPGSPALQVDS